ncbi:XRE family transcriptional regulator [Saccharothrix sp.]|uniref:helix-turn-helix domain-containing protein n=1 Tax=Saccharothrix sp. TaxID=1873460 RepID=UPI002811D852|nr:XRE family transcriptional regulator [Saccharothrix sp.]
MFELTELADRIQRLRGERRLTLSALAERCSVSVSMLSAVERAEKAPTVTVLARIAEGLDVPLIALLEDIGDRRVVVRRRADQERTVHAAGWERVVVSPVVAGVNFELVRVTLPAGCDAGAFPAYARGSHEYVAVEQGTLRLTVGGRVIDLAVGDSTYFEADQAHGFANTTDEVCAYYVAALIMRPR